MFGPFWSLVFSISLWLLNVRTDDLCPCSVKRSLVSAAVDGSLGTCIHPPPRCPEKHQSNKQIEMTPFIKVHCRLISGVRQNDCLKFRFPLICLYKLRQITQYVIYRSAYFIHSFLPWVNSLST